MAQTGYSADPHIAYAQKLAEVAVRVAALTEAERANFAPQIQDMEARKAKLTPEQRVAYNERVAALAQAQVAAQPQAPAPRPAAPRQAPPAPRVSAPQPAPEDDLDGEDEYSPYEEDSDMPRPKKKKKRGRGCLTVFLVLLVLLALAFGGAYWWVSGEIGGRRGTSVSASVEIAKGSSPTAVGRALEQAHIIRSAQVFRFWVRGQEGLADKLQYGKFTLTSDMSYEQLAKALQTTSDDRSTVTVTFPEGIPAVEFANRLEAAGLCTAKAFLEEANSGDYSDLRFWSKRAENANQFMACEGYLFPDTYQFFAGDSVKNIVRKFYAEFDSKMTDEIYTKIDSAGMTLSQFMTLASLVQEEAGGVAHQADVAAIFMNRLAPDSPVKLLQSNCSSYIQKANDNNYLYNTVAWYYGDWSKIPKEIIAAYDTYATPGLPAGPISNPGMDAIRNTLSYAQSQYYGKGYYFFVTDTDGNYYFNQTAEAHEKQCDILRAAGKMAG